jgi:uncharacterized lipoprotein YmbA
MNVRRFSTLPMFVLAACGSVEVPRERFFRLDPPAAAAPAATRGGVLRVQDLQPGTALEGECLLVQHGVRREPHPLERWIAPLDRLVTDALVLGLSRARVCDLVKGGADPGPETWTLHGRIVEFSEFHDPSAGNGSEARVTLELWLEEHDRLLFHDEFTAKEPITAEGPEAAVRSLSVGLQRVVQGVVQRMDGQGLFAAARAAAPPAR